ncbi:MAG: hypothetical protein DME93_08565 [Verrucomicrobia bacterium]|nr:MAG: hypothetical protein DME93_08565 [Verrucomicrobiota bacterium]
MRLGQFAPAGEPTALSDLGQIFANLLLGFIHSRTSKEWQAERLPYNSFVWAIMHHKPLMMQETRRVGRESSARAPNSKSDWHYVPEIDVRSERSVRPRRP